MIHHETRIFYSPSNLKHNKSLHSITINGKSVSVLIDSGSTVTVIRNQTLSATGITIKVETCKKKIFAFGIKSYYQSPSALWLKSQLPNSMFQRNSLSLKSRATPSMAKIPQHYWTCSVLVHQPITSIPSQQSHQLQLNELIKYKDRFKKQPMEVFCKLTVLHLPGSLKLDKLPGAT